jgi:Rrf2 family protein
MKISTRSRYGLKAIANLALKQKCCSTKDIAKEEHIPFEYLEKIFSRLKKDGILDVKRGVAGGYILSRDPKSISIGEILQSLEGKFTPVKCIADDKNFSCPHNSKCLNRKMWQKIQNVFISSLNSISLFNLIHQND